MRAFNFDQKTNLKMALIYLGYRQLKNRKKKKGDDSEEVEEKTVLSEMNLEKQNRKKKTLVGAGAGAAIGTVILPGVGTAIGAGAGAVAGKLSGKKKSKPSQKTHPYPPKPKPVSPSPREESPSITSQSHRVTYHAAEPQAPSPAELVDERGAWPSVNECFDEAPPTYDEAVDQSRSESIYPQLQYV